MTKRVLITTVMTLFVPALGCDVPPPDEGSDVDTDTASQAHTSAEKVINAQPDTTANTGVKKWKLTRNTSKHGTTIKAVNAKGKTLATVVLSNREINGAFTVELGAEGFGESIACSLNNGDGVPFTPCDLPDHGLLAEIVGGLRSDMEAASQTGAQSSALTSPVAGAEWRWSLECVGAVLIEVAYCAGAAGEALLNPILDAKCVGSALLTDAACD
jgi:hypothetical protein